jgi:hypothetical protein
VAEGVVVSENQLFREDGGAVTPTFALSPQVPNPVSPNSSTGAISFGEVSDLIAMEPTLVGSDTLFVGNMAALGIFAPIANNAAETSLVQAPLAVPALAGGATWRIVAAGTCKNNKGSSGTITFRFKIGSVALAAVTVTLANDAGTRAWRYIVDGVANDATTGSMTGHIVVAPSGADPLQQAVTSEVSFSLPGIAADFNVTEQMSAANANFIVTSMAAIVQYGLP